MTNNIVGIVYIIKNKKNDKKYIGITTSKKGFNGRYRAKGVGIERVYGYLLACKKNNAYYNNHLFKAIEKDGIKNFEVDDSFDKAYSKKELIEKEQQWIRYYKSNIPEFGYNFSEGGEGVLTHQQNLTSKLKRRIKYAHKINSSLNMWCAIAEENNGITYNIWKYGDDLPEKYKYILSRKLKHEKNKFCKICGIEYYRSGHGDYCEYCGKVENLNEYKKHKKIIKKLLK